MTLTLCTAWSIDHLLDSLVLLAHTQSAVLPSQLVDNQSCYHSLPVPSRILVYHSADRQSTGECVCRRSSRQSYCCRESYSHPGRLLADRAALKRRLNISKVVLPYNNLLRLGIQEFIEDFILVNLPWVLESSVFFTSLKARCIVVCPIVTATIYIISFESTVTGAVKWTRSVVALSICRAIVCVLFALVDICLLNWIRWKLSTWNVFALYNWIITVTETQTETETQTQTIESASTKHRHTDTQANASETQTQS